MEKWKRSLLIIIRKPELIFLLGGVVFGLLFMILTPPFAVPDESGHLHRAVEVSNGVLYNYKKHVAVSETDKIFYNTSEFTSAFKDVGKCFHFQSGYSPVMYFAAAVGVKTGYLFKNAFMMFYLARLFNFFVWLVLIYAAISLTPVFKWHFCIFALLPMNIFEGMSVSADSFVNGFCLLFFAYMFKLIFENYNKLSNRQISVYAIFAFIASLLKGCLIYPEFLMLLVKDKRRYLISVVVTAISVFIGGLWILGNYVAVGPEVNPVQNKLILFSEPLKVLWIVIKTMVLNWPSWYTGFIGALKCSPPTAFPLPVYICTAIVYILNFFFIGCEKKIVFKHRFFAGCLILLFFIVILTALFCTWTPVGHDRVGGFQGRYLYSILPLFFMLLSRNSTVKFESKFKIFTVCYVFCLLVYSCYFLIMVY